MGTASRQFWAMLRKNMWLKRSKPIATLMEVLLPSFFVLLLAIGFWLADENYSDSSKYGESGLVSNITELLSKVSGKGGEATVLFCRLNETNTVLDTVLPLCEAKLKNMRCLGYPLEEFCVVDYTALGILIDLMQFLSEPLAPPSFDLYILLSKYAYQYEMHWDGFMRRDVKESLLHYGYMGFIVNPDQMAPHGPITSAHDIPFVKYCIETTVLCKRIIDLNPSLVFGAEEPAVEYSTSHGASVWSIIDLREVNPPLSNKYTIRLNYTATPWTFQTLLPLQQGLGKHSYILYAASGFSTLQEMMNRFILKTTYPDDPSISNEYSLRQRTNFAYTPFPTSGYRSNQFLSSSGHFIPLVLTFGMLYSLSKIVSGVVEEKEGRLREAMLIMGLRPLCFYGSWLVTNVVLELFASLLAAMLAKVTFFTTVDYFVLWTVMYSFALQVVAFGFLVTVFFSKARVAAITAPLLLFVTAVPYYAFQEGTPDRDYMIASLIPCTAFAHAINAITGYVTSSVPVTVGSFGGPGYNIGLSIVFNLVDFVWYLLLALYLDQVLPSEFGVKKHPLFIVPGFKKWWSRRKVEENNALMEHAAASRKRTTSASFVEEGEDEPIEPTGRSASDTPAVQVQGLTKVYKKGKKLTAVDSLNLSLYHGEVLSLLGHNGAGKSTTIHMLVGLTDPTAGTIDAFGSMVAAKGVAAFKELRGNTGYCPQHNVIWPTLTVRQHLMLFAVLKGCTWEEAATNTTFWVKRVALEEKIDAVAKSLSGGQKRKLCVAIAFIGDSKLVILDEPTAGMDVHSRRSLWDAIIAQRPNCATLLCTHFMDEADLLSTRIAIMLRGQLKCMGSSLFLKQRLGLGYKLTFVVKEGTREIEDRIASTLRQYGTNPKKEDTNSALELRYQLDLAGRATTGGTPLEGEEEIGLVEERSESAVAVRSGGGDPAGLFSFLEANRDSLGIRMMGLSLTNLEEVFLSIARKMEGLLENSSDDDHKDQGKSTDANGATKDEKRTGEKEEGDDDVALTTESTRLLISGTNGGEAKPNNSSSGGAYGEETESPSTGFELYRKQLVAQFLKRVHCAKRDRRTMCFQFVLPIVFLTIALLILLLKAPNQPAVFLDMSMYGTGNIVSELLVTNGTQQDIFEGAPRLQYAIGPYGDNRSTGLPCDPGVGMLVPQQCAKDLINLLLDEINSHAAMRLIALAGKPRNSPESYHTEAFHNSTAPHALPQATNLLYNSILLEKNPALPPIVVVNHPLPLAAVEHHVVDSIRRVISAIFILIPFTFIPANYVTFIVRERSSKAQHLQWVSGAFTGAYWFSSYFFDLCQYLVTEFLAILIFVIFKREEFIGDPTTFAASFLLFFMYAVASIPMSYLMSFIFTKHTTAQNVVMFVNFFFGFLLVLAAQIMGAIPKTRDANRMLTKFYRIVPSYALGEGLITLTGRELAGYLLGHKPDAFALLEFNQQGGFIGGVGTSLAYLGATAPVLCFALLVIEWTRVARHRAALKLASMSTSSGDTGDEEEHFDDGFPPDPEVAQEKAHIANAAPSELADDNSLVFRRLEKRFGKLRAIKGVTYGVRRGEIFALLGANGAGKTTTIGIVTGDVVQTKGRVEVCGLDTLTSLQTVRQFVGYCPQFDALLDTMTPAEHLRFYLRLRGYSNASAKHQATALMRQLGLLRYKDRPAQALSGGNRRRLSLAIAIAGNPAVVLLDEPSAGMDPLARRDLWTVVGKIAQSRSVVLTTHHLEEVEALADRVGIMVHGSMRCIGTLQTLKTRYGGASYEVVISLRPSCNDDISPCEANPPVRDHNQTPEKVLSRHMEENLSSGGSVKTLEYLGEANHLVLGITEAPLSAIFAALHTFPQKKTGIFFNFAVNQASLEQTFLSVAGGGSLESDNESEDDD